MRAFQRRTSRGDSRTGESLRFKRRRPSRLRNGNKVSPPDSAKWQNKNGRRVLCKAKIAICFLRFARDFNGKRYRLLTRRRKLPLNSLPSFTRDRASEKENNLIFNRKLCRIKLLLLLQDSDCF